MFPTRQERRSDHFSRFGGVIFLLAIAGCSGDDQPIRQRGIVTLAGQPLAGVTVTFMSENRRPASATTDEQGRFDLMTFSPGDGAFRGEYKVVVASNTTAQWGEPLARKPEKNVPAIHPNYQSIQITPLRRVIPAPEGTIVLNLNKDGT